MKRLFSFLSIIAIIALSNCSRTTNKNNPVIGAWSNISAIGKDGSKILSKWIFNDAHLGRYQVVEHGSITTKADFQWTETDGIYTISYPGLERVDEKVTLNETPKGLLMKQIDGNILAVQE